MLKVYKYNKEGEKDSGGFSWQTVQSSGLKEKRAQTGEICTVNKSFGSFLQELKQVCLAEGEEFQQYLLK